MVYNIEIKLIFAVMACLVAVVGGYAPYIRDIFLKKTKPHAYTWLIWAVTQGTAAAGSQYGQGGWGTIFLVIGAGFIFFIFLWLCCTNNF